MTQPALASTAPRPDPDLESLPEPRRPWRRLTLATLVLTTLGSLGMAVGLGDSLRYGLSSADPLELGALTDVQLAPGLANQWAHAAGKLESAAIEYRRPLEGDRFRLSRAEGNPKLWVRVRVPDELDKDRYVAPGSFVGRLVPADSLDLRHAGLVRAIERPTATPLEPGTWFLLDGEAPSTTRWVIGLVGLFIAFAIFSIFGIFRLVRPVRDT